MVSYQAYSLSDVGKKRKQNEDSFLVAEDLNLFIVADGMGGHEAGDVASQNAVQEMLDVIKSNRQVLELSVDPNPARKRQAIMELLEKAVHSANDRIFKMGRINTEKKKMGTTLSCLMLADNHGFIAHVGDTRIYLIRKERIYQLTEDHSLVNQYIKQGRLSEEEARNFPYQNVITRAVGNQEWVEVDLIDFELEQDDRFIIASDGLTGLINDQELLDQVTGNPLEFLPRVLIDKANERGGKDNITTIVVALSSIPQIGEVTTPISIKISSLKSVPLFQKLSYQQLSQVANLLTEHRYSRGDKIITEGEVGDKFFICQTGSVQVRKGQNVITRLKAGDYFGEMALVDNSPRSADVIARENCLVLGMSRRDLAELIRRNPQIAIKFLWSFTQVLTKRLRKTSTELSLIMFDIQMRDTDVLPGVNDLDT